MLSVLNNHKDDKESRLFRDFQRGSTDLLELSPANKYYNKRKNELLIELLDIREEIKLLVEVKDIRDEINIILSVLGIQRTLIEQMSQLGERSAFLRTPAAEDIVRADIYDFSKLDGHTRTIQDKVRRDFRVGTCHLCSVAQHLDGSQTKGCQRVGGARSS
jgi:hypothetical protein